MKNLPFASIFTLVFCALVFSQTNKTSSCPTVDIIGPDGISPPNKPVKYSINVDTKGKDLKLEYVWSVPNGKIIEGQGTSSIKTEYPSRDSLHVSVEVKGFPEGCPNTDSESLIWDPAPVAVKFDEFEKANKGDIKSRLDSFMNQLYEDPNARAYIINYGSIKDIAKREKAIINSITFLKIDSARITIVRGGFRKNLKTQFWIVPSGASNPEIEDNN